MSKEFPNQTPEQKPNYKSVEEIQKKINELFQKYRSSRANDILKKVHEGSTIIQEEFRTIESKYPEVLLDNQIDKLLAEDGFSRFEKFINIDPKLFYGDINMNWAAMRFSQIQQEKGLEMNETTEEKELTDEFRKDRPILGKERLEIVEKIQKIKNNSFDNYYIKEEVLGKHLKQIKKIEAERMAILNYLKSPNTETGKEIRRTVLSYGGHYNHFWGGGVVTVFKQQDLINEINDDPTLSNYFLNCKTLSAFYVKLIYSEIFLDQFISRNLDYDKETKERLGVPDFTDKDYDIEDFKYYAPRIIAAIETIQDEYCKYFESKDKK